MVVGKDSALVAERQSLHSAFVLPIQIPEIVEVEVVLDRVPPRRLDRLLQAKRHQAVVHS